MKAAYLGSIIFMTALAASGCSQEQPASEIKVTNGQPTAGFPSVIKLSFGNGGICSATFINAHTALTAAHCVDSGPVSYLGIQAKRAVRHPAYKRSILNSPYDLAFVEWGAGIAPAYSLVGGTQPTVGDEVTIVGFGVNDGVTNTGAGVKRYGTNTLSSTDSWYYKVLGQSDTTDASGQDGAAAPGDSGGPMVYQGRVIGVASWIRRSGQIEAHYTNLNSDTARQFFQYAANQGYSIPGYTKDPTADSPTPPTAQATGPQSTGSGGSGGTGATNQPSPYIKLGLDLDPRSLPAADDNFRILLGVELSERLLALSVSASGLAAQSGLKAGDRIVGVGRFGIRSLDDYDKVMTYYGKLRVGQIVLTIWRNGRYYRATVSRTGT